MMRVKADTTFCFKLDVMLFTSPLRQLNKKKKKRDKPLT
jgi:hypothetical protein